MDLFQRGMIEKKGEEGKGKRWNEDKPKAMRPKRK